MGEATVIISKPNALDPIFNPDLDYYRSNIEDVEISIGYTNQVSKGDYFRIIFPARVYTLTGTVA